MKSEIGVVVTLNAGDDAHQARDTSTVKCQSCRVFMRLGEKTHNSPTANTAESPAFRDVFICKRQMQISGKSNMARSVKRLKEAVETMAE